jgi:acyl carrier protein
MTTPLHEMTAIIRDVLRNPSIELTLAAQFDDILGCDSMDLVSIVVEAECRFDVLFDLEDIEQIVTVGDLIRLVDAKRAPVARQMSDSESMH